MSAVWNEMTEKILLLAVIEFPDGVPRARFEAAAMRLGGAFTWNACR